MNKCEKCSANPIVCEYCIHKNSYANKSSKNSYNEKVIYYNSERYDNESKKICSVCKKIYTDYSAISRKDNKTLICSECGRKEIQEPLEEILEEYGIDIIYD